MTTRNRHTRLVTAGMVLALTAVCGADEAKTAREIIDAAGVRGGLVVHVGCGSTGSPQAAPGRLTAALRVNESCQVHGLAVDEADVAAAREAVRKAGLYGPVCIGRMVQGKLPYADNLVNLVVVSDASLVGAEEIGRVLQPGGVCIRRGSGGEGWDRKVKPRPAELDDWTHYMHSAGGNAVSNDTVVGPPRRLQWVGSPRWSRHHEHMSSFSAMVSAAGRVFYINDEGPRLSIHLPPQWKLVARDAFNGCVLWKRDISRWYTHLFPLKSGPAYLPRRLVAVQDRVYVTLGLGEPLVCLDAATGETVRTYDQAQGAEEVLCSDGVLFVVADARPLKPERHVWTNTVCWDERNRMSRQRAWDQKNRDILAIDARTGKTRWRIQSPIAPITLSADADRVAFHDGKSVVCLDRATGKPKWTSKPVTMRLPLQTSYAPTLVLAGEVVLFAGGNRKMSGLSAETGDALWTAPHYPAGHHSPEDVLVIDGLAWTGFIAGGGHSGLWTGYDVKTGKVKREFKPDVEDTYWFHHRCYRAKATVNYLIPSRTGVEFVDWRKEHWMTHHWVRGACIYGVMPANGLLYAPQHPCACYIESKLNGLSALAPASKTPLPKPAEADRLTKGPAYETVAEANADSAEAAQDWPTYRHDGVRSGCATTEVPADLKQTWQVKLEGKLSSVVVADGRCYLSAIDAHTVHAFDAATGKPLWRFTAGGPVDSPPTIHNGCAIFGCNDGYVYCVRAADGKLAWRYLAAWADRRTMAFERLESLWPVHGSVLVRDGIVHCVAGRSAFLDGGMRLCRIDAATGKLVSETALDNRAGGDDEGALQAAHKGLNMPPALPDVLSGDANSLYMRSQRFDLQGKRTELYAGSGSWNELVAQETASRQAGSGVHLFCGTGFLDGSWFHRSYWLYGRNIHNGCNFWFRAARYAPSGRIMVFDDDHVFCFGRQPKYMLWTPALEYRLFATNRKVSTESIQRVLRRGKTFTKDRKGKRWIFDREYAGTIPPDELSAADAKWESVQPPILVRAMALAGETLFVAGPPDLIDEEAAVARHWDPDVAKQIADQQAALDAKRPSLLWAVSAETGKRLTQLKLDAPPVWDSMAAARGRLYLTTTDGTLRCFAGQ